VLKVDRSFVDDVGHLGKGNALAAAIVQLRQTLKMGTIAEGIEDPAQADYLQTLGCGFGQGFYFAQAMTADAMEEMLPGMASGETFGAVAGARGIQPY
jgi:EAL domain-containing protein (putative c-di-GMP-specific phosphodiesterase class I)